MKIRIGCVALGFLSLVLSVAAQTSGSTGSIAQLPHLVKFSGTLKDVSGNALTGVVGVTFALYSEPSGGAPLWLETQNVQPDKNGHYTVLLGSMKPEGLPVDLFVSEQARWLGVRPEGQAEAARVLLVAVPYAMKAADAETLGGLPPSAFALALPVSTATSLNDAAASTNTPSVAPLATSNVTTTGGTVNAIPLFTTATNVQNSILTQTGSTAVNVGGKLNLPATGAATATAGKNSRPETLVASSFSSTTSTAVNQTFQWQAEPAANNTANPSGTLNLLYGLGATTPTETGLKLSNKGIFTFATGQTFPGTGAGTVKSVALTAPASDFTVSGSPVTSTGTLNLAWTVAPTSANTANAIVKRDGSGNLSAGTITATTANLLTLTANSGAPLPIYGVTSSGFGTGIEGAATATTGATHGVFGATASSDSNAYGVYGYASSSSGSPVGVYGQANSVNGIGVHGQDGSASKTAANFAVGGFGVWGDGGASGTGVVGTVDDGYAGIFKNNSTANITLYAQNDSLSPSTSTAFLASGVGGQGCSIDGLGDLSCTGTKNAVVPVDGGKRRVALSAIESPKNWFEDAGSTELVNGSAVVMLDPDFIQTVNTEMEYNVFLTPYGDCKGLYVTNRTVNSFQVHELGSGSASISFGYRIMALRKNYENVRFADHTNDPDPLKMMQHMKEMRAKQQATIGAAAQPVAEPK